MSDENEYRPIRALIVIALTIAAFIALAFPQPVRAIGAVFLIGYWTVVGYHFRRSIWQPKQNQLPNDHRP